MVFEREYISRPVVNVTLVLHTTSTVVTTTEDIPEISPESILFDHKLRYVTLNQTSKGFSVLLDQDAPVDIEFSWIALAVKDATTVYSEQIEMEESAVDSPVEQDQTAVEVEDDQDINTEESSLETSTNTEANTDVNQEPPEEADAGRQ